MYEKIVEKQRNTIIGIEIKYRNMVRNRMDKIEAFMDELAMEQANLNSKVAVFSTEANLFKTEESRFEENGLFPNKTIGSVYNMMDASSI